MRMLRCVCGVAKLDNIINGIKRGTKKVGTSQRKSRKEVGVVWACD